MFNLGKLFVAFEAKTDQFDAALKASEQHTRATAAKIGALGTFKLGGDAAGPRQATSALGLLTAGAHAASAAVKGLGRTLLGLGGLAVAYGLVKFFAGGIKGAVELNETVSKVEAVFGASAGKVKAQGEAMAKEFGLSKKQMLDGAAAIGLLGKAAGQSESQAADLGNSMAKLAADSMSFFDKDFDVALDKIRAGLSGESEPLRAFGVLLNEDAVKAEALALKLAKSSKGLDEQAKVMARASLIRKGLADPTGDLERTADSASNQFRKLGGGIENFSVAIGTALYPAIQTGAVALNELAATVIETFESNKAAVEGFGQYLASGFEIIGTLIRNGGTVWKIMEVQVGAFVANAIAWIDTLPANLAIVAQYVGNNWYQLISDAFHAVGAIFTNFGTNIGNLAYAVYAFLKNPAGGFEFEWTPLLDGFQATADALPEMIKPALVDVSDEIAKLGQKITDEATAHAAKAKAIVKKAEQKKAAKDEFKSDTLDFAEFARKLRAEQLSKKDQTAEKQIKALDDNKAAIEANTAAQKTMTITRFA